MKMFEYLVFAALLTPTLVVAVAVVITLTTPSPVPGYGAPVLTAHNAHK